MLGAGGGPVPQLKLARVIFNQRRAIFHPVANVAVHRAIEFADLRPVNVAANDAAVTAATRHVGGGLLKAANILHGVADPGFEIAGERPVAVTEQAADRVEVAVQDDREVVGTGAERGEPATATHGTVKLIAVQHQQLEPGGSGVGVFAVNFQVAEAEARELPQVDIVIAGYVNDARVVLGLAEDRAQHIVVQLRPVKVAAHGLQIDDVADQKQLFGLDPMQEIEQQVGAAFARAQMQIRQEDAAHAGGDRL